MRTAMLIQTSASDNHNKFYELTLHDDGRVVARFGRVGANGQTSVIGQGEHVFDRQVEKKKRRGYQDAGITTTTSATSSGALTQAGAALAAGDPLITDLVNMLIRINAHSIEVASGGKIAVSTSGSVTTPLGPVSMLNITQARDLLSTMERGDLDVLDQYLMLIPQRVPAKRGWSDTFFDGFTTFADQSKLLDQLEDSVRFSTATDTGDNLDDVFRYRLAVVDDAKIIGKIDKDFRSTANASHATSQSTLRRVYALTDVRRDQEVADTQQRIGNVRPMWHGSRAANVLSILATGLQVPGRGAGHVTGRMFGDGLYFSEQSSKSLNYSRGGVWSSGRDSRYFVFRADVAMGWECRPNLHGINTGSWGGGSQCNDVLSGKIRDKHRRFDSINVKGGTCGVRNHEAIVPGPDQSKLVWLCEFSD